MKLYVANCTAQAQSLNFRMVEGRGRGFSTQNIAMGQQVQLAGDLNLPQIDYIVGQLGIYGMRRVEELDGIRHYVPLVYSIDKHVPAKLMEQIIQFNRGLLKERGSMLRREAAIATSHGMRALGLPQAADNVSLSIEEEKGGTMDHGGDEPLAEGFRMTREIAA
jgi:hypothetical protein